MRMLQIARERTITYDTCCRPHGDPRTRARNTATADLFVRLPAYPANVHSMSCIPRGVYDVRRTARKTRTRVSGCSRRALTRRTNRRCCACGRATFCTAKPHVARLANSRVKRRIAGFRFGRVPRDRSAADAPGISVTFRRPSCEHFIARDRRRSCLVRHSAVYVGNAFICPAERYRTTRGRHVLSVRRS